MYRHAFLESSSNLKTTIRHLICLVSQLYRKWQLSTRRPKYLERSHSNGQVCIPLKQQNYESLMTTCKAKIYGCTSGRFGVTANVWPWKWRSKTSAILIEFDDLTFLVDLQNTLNMTFLSSAYMELAKTGMFSNFGPYMTATNINDLSKTIWQNNEFRWFNVEN